MVSLQKTKSSGRRSVNGARRSPCCVPRVPPLTRHVQPRADQQQLRGLWRNVPWPSQVSEAATRGTMVVSDKCLVLWRLVSGVRHQGLLAGRVLVCQSRRRRHPHYSKASSPPWEIWRNLRSARQRSQTSARLPVMTDGMCSSVRQPVLRSHATAWVPALGRTTSRRPCWSNRSPRSDPRLPPSSRHYRGPTCGACTQNAEGVLTSPRSAVTLARSVRCAACVCADAASW